MTSATDERVVWSETFYAETFDFRGRMQFCRFDECTFIRCTLLLDEATEQIAFTHCIFKDCSIDHLDSDKARGIDSIGNTFDKPLAEKRKEFDDHLATILRKRGESQSR
jgi:hypothetical protein